MILDAVFGLVEKHGATPFDVFDLLKTDVEDFFLVIWRLTDDAVEETPETPTLSKRPKNDGFFDF